MDGVTVSSGICHLNDIYLNCHEVYGLFFIQLTGHQMSSLFPGQLLSYTYALVLDQQKKYGKN